MKLNFKKIVPVLTGAILLGSTIGFASSVGAVTYPESFSDAVVVVGSAANVADLNAANSIGLDLGKLSATDTLSGPDVVAIKSSANNLNVGDTLSAVHPTSIDNGDLPTLLADGVFQASGNSYDYTQEIDLASGLTFTNVKDDDLSPNPVVGVALTADQAVVNYTLSFTKNAESDIESTNHMVDFEDATIEILGKEYTILNAFNTTNIKLELLGGAVNSELEEGASAPYTVDNKEYTVEANFIGETTVKMIVNGESTSSLEAGETYTLKDGTEIGIRDIMYTGKTGSASKVEFTLGAEKMILENGQEVEMGEDTVDGLTCFITGGADYISEIKLQWVTEDKAFISNLGALEFPGLKSFKFQAGELSLPLKENIAVKNNGDEKVSLTFPFKTGVKTFDLMFGSATNFTGLGKDATHSIARSTGTSILFNESAHDYFVATYISGTVAESYLLEASTSESDDINYTSVKDVVTGDYFCEDKKPTQTCKVGSIVLTVGAIDPVADTVNLSATAGTFDRIVSKEGLEMLLPAVATTDQTVKLQFVEEDKEGGIADGATFNVTVGWSDSKVQVTQTEPSVTSYEMGDTDVYEAYVASDLATKLTYDKSGDQDFVEIEYHGEEVTGNVWITAPNVVAGSNPVVKDTEMTSVQKAGDMIVVGGPAINSVAAELLGLSSNLVMNQGSASGFAPNGFQITLFTDKPVPGKVALLVAGYEKEDTSAAAKALIAEHKFGTGTTTTTAAGYTLQ